LHLLKITSQTFGKFLEDEWATVIERPNQSSPPISSMGHKLQMAARKTPGTSHNKLTT